MSLCPGASLGRLVALVAIWAKVVGFVEASTGVLAQEAAATAVEEENTETVAAKLDSQALVAAAATSSSCTSGMVGKMRSIAPSCIGSCQGSCWALDSAVSAYMRGGRDGAKRDICSHKSAFGCFMSSSNRGKCMPLFNKAREVGLSLPTTWSELDSQCRSRRLEEVEEAAAKVPAQGVAQSDRPGSLRGAMSVFFP